MENKPKLTADEISEKQEMDKLNRLIALGNQKAAREIKRTAFRKLKVNIFFFVLGAAAGFFGLTYSGALDINCLAEKGYVPQSVVQPYNGMLLKVKARLNG